MLDQQKITILYCRLSNEDAQEGESNSIANQREYLTRYARDHGYTNLKILVDDGYTGTNFNRPGVQEGFELVKQGLVGCWLVKDLSRFGRDYLTVGQYTPRLHRPPCPHPTAGYSPHHCGVMQGPTTPESTIFGILLKKSRTKSRKTRGSSY